jgi:integrase
MMPRTFGELISHYRQTELAPENPNKAYSTKIVYADFIDNWILPRWRDHELQLFSGAIAVRIESWLRDLDLESPTKAKLRSILSAICSHARRWGWMALNPVASVRQSAKSARRKATLSVDELQRLFVELAPLDRLLVLLDVPTGMRVGELLAVQWCDIDFIEHTLHIHQSMWRQHLGPTKTAESEQTVPLDGSLIDDLLAWRQTTPYAADRDWVFASPKMFGKQPYWPSARMRHIRSAAKGVGISKHISWHVFRHTYSTLLLQNNEDVKTVQSLMRHASIRVTMEIYAHAVSDKKRAAQSKVVAMIAPQQAWPKTIH